jgi:zinc transport system substrate-binding protein
MPVFVSILPQQYFVRQVGGDLVDISVMVAPGASPAAYEPKPRQMSALSAAHIYFAIGVPFEDVWLEKITAANPAMRVVHTEQGIRKIPITSSGEGHPGHDHHGRLDPHIWLAPALVMLQARSILTALVAEDPGHRSVYLENYRRFIGELVALDAELIEIFSQKGRGNRFMVFHPAWGYFAHTYGLEQVPIEVEGKSPKPAQLQRLIDHARREEIRVIFVQPQFSTQNARVVAEAIDGEVISADPLAADWAANIREQARRFKAAMR